MKYLILMIVLSLLAGTAHGSFETEDPANSNIHEQLLGESENKNPMDSEGSRVPDGWISQGAGSTTCSEFLSFIQQTSAKYSSSLYWLQGFIDGASYQQKASQDSVHDRTTVAIWFQNYCRKNASKTLAEAAAAFIEDRD